MLKTLNIQIQPDRSSALDAGEAIRHLRALAADTTVSDGNDDGRYVNVGFRANDLRGLWAVISTAITEIAGLSDAAIVTCEGESGWDDYLLLHHFDPSQPLDKISN